MNPIGMQRASGLSLLLAAMRCLTSSAAHGWYGRPSLNPDPTLPKLAGATSSSDTSAGAGAAAAPRPGGAAPRAAAAPLAGAAGVATPPAAPPRPPPFRHTPDRSRLPSAVLG